MIKRNNGHGLQPYIKGPVPGIMNGVHEILEPTSDIFGELKSRLIHSMSLFIVICVCVAAGSCTLTCGRSAGWQK